MPKNMPELLLVIDAQVDFTNIAGNYAKKHAGITQILAAKKNINRLIKNIPAAIVLSSYTPGQFKKNVSLCIPGTAGHALDIETGLQHIFFHKTQHSCFSSADFINYLQQHNISHLIICGFLAEYCVQQTADDALQRCITVTLLEDCIGTGDDVQHRKTHTLQLLSTKGAIISKSC
jgi:nicotinamidase/pyrazinamidase